MQAGATPQLDANAALSTEALAALQQRSDARGLLRLFGHFAAIGAASYGYSRALASSAPLAFGLLGALALGFTLVTMFAAMHESVHRTAFKTRWLNDAVAWLAGLLSFYNSTFYRPYHGWHHRFTQLPGKDPELEDVKPTSLPGYAWQLSGLPWWYGKLRTHFTLALGKTSRYPFLNERTAPLVVRSVRLQLLTYAAASAGSVAVMEPYFLQYWLLPVALAQPLLRAILLAEHGGCSEDDNPLSNTRTTYTTRLVRFLMWEMPYHAEHHRYPALPFFSLAPTHLTLGPRLSFVARRGYTGFHAALLRDLAKRTPRVARDQP